METGFRTLTVENWRQFRRVELDLSNQLTVITGENGAGKTSLLSLLSGHFGFVNNFIGTPTRRDGRLRFEYGSTSSHLSDAATMPHFDTFGLLEYDSGNKTEFGTYADMTNDGSVAEFAVQFLQQGQVAGISLDSHRIVPSYGRVESIPGRFRGANEIIHDYRAQLHSLRQPYGSPKTPIMLMKESLVAAAVYSESSSAIRMDPVAAEVWTGFQGVLHELLPESLGFQRLQIDQAEVLIETRSGSFALESVSGGANAIFDLAWQIYLQSRESEHFTVCIDEPENHLHPSLQRSILSKLLRAFPAVRFIVATHSPFVVTSAQDSQIYALRKDAEGFVYSELLDLKKQAMSADEVLRDVLGVDSTLPIWAESAWDKIMAQYSGKPLDEIDVPELARQLRKAGLNFAMPEIAASMAKVSQDREEP